MNITRHGAKRFRGVRSIISRLPLTTGAKGYFANNVNWQSLEKTISITAPWVEDASGKSHHVYKISLTLDDVAALIELLGHAGSKKDAKLLRDKLKESVPAIVKLLACATGLEPTEIAEEATDLSTAPKKRRRPIPKTLSP